MKYQRLAISTPFVLLITCPLFLDLTYAIKAIDAEISIDSVNFDTPFNNTLNLGTPFLEYDNTSKIVSAYWPINRQPYLLETTFPRVFAVGDVHSGSIKLVVSAVGEGSIAISFVHKVLQE